MLGVVTIMTALAHGHQIVIGAMLWLMIQMRHSKHDAACGDRVWSTMPCSARLAAPPGSF